MRPSFDEWAMQMAELVASRSTCHRRSVGAVLTNARRHVLATGYNGRPASMAHCNTQIGDGSRPWLCEGAMLPSGTGLDLCEAVHAEQNALLQCHDVYDIETCYTTTSPCLTCVKLLMNTSCRRIIFAEPYPHDAAKQLWTSLSRHEWIHFVR